LIAALLMVGVASLVFGFFQRQLSTASFAFGSHPEVLEQLTRSLEDQRHLSELDPQAEEVYRERFGEIETTVHRLQILDHNRTALVERYETVMLFVFASIVILVTGIYAWRQSRLQPRLDKLQQSLMGLAEGRTDLELGERGRDTVARIAAMIERTSRLMARDRRRLAALDNLSAWQEAARRHAHEMRTPLTGLQLELGRADQLLAEEGPGEEVRTALASAGQEADRLREFAQRFTSFARLPTPRPARHDLAALVVEFATTYSSAWENLRLETAASEVLPVDADRDQLRQVLVNLAENSSRALGEASGRLRLSCGSEGASVFVDAADTGPGVPEDVRSRIFEPYSTTRGIGEGMGLGLAICKKILLDHDGDLELVETEEGGATFRLSLPRAVETRS
jgi:C4-dicarboxylate-specific signal transduction histidine kinase